MDRKCIVIGAADDDLDRTFLERAIELSGADKPYIYCADGGIRHARKLALFPDMLIGDMDSVEEAYSQADVKGIAHEIVRLPREKDETDLFACVNDGLRKGYTNFTLIFCTNGRIDHFMAAAAILEYLDERQATGRILDNRNEITFMKPGRMEILRDGRFKYLSIIPLDEELSGIRLQGVKYPLFEARVRRSEMCLLVSNEIAGASASVEIQEGRALIIQSRDRAD